VFRLLFLATRAINVTTATRSGRTNDQRLNRGQQHTGAGAEQPKAKRKPTRKGKAAKKPGHAKKAGSKPKAERANKKAEVIALMKCAKGATLAEIRAVAKWQAHMCRASSIAYMTVPERILCASESKQHGRFNNGAGFTTGEFRRPRTCGTASNRGWAAGDVGAATLQYYGSNGTGITSRSIGRFFRWLE
jgi:uncharacterized protein DUF3489